MGYFCIVEITVDFGGCVNFGLNRRKWLIYNHTYDLELFTGSFLVTFSHFRLGSVLPLLPTDVPSVDLKGSIIWSRWSLQFYEQTDPILGLSVFCDIASDTNSCSD
jgi:hypothetical protein